jgi:hypothetical protein
MGLLAAVGIVIATILGTELLVEIWLGEPGRFWVTLVGLAMLGLGAALVQASGAHEVTRILRTALLGAWIGAALRRLGMKVPLLRRGLRLAGIETEPETAPPPAGLRWSGLSTGLLYLGSAGSLVGIGVVWTGLFGG